MATITIVTASESNGISQANIIGKVGEELSKIYSEIQVGASQGNFRLTYEVTGDISKRDMDKIIAHIKYYGYIVSLSTPTVIKIGWECC